MPGAAAAEWKFAGTEAARASVSGRAASDHVGTRPEAAAAELLRTFRIIGNDGCQCVASKLFVRRPEASEPSLHGILEYSISRRNT